jgi:SAM-dependent methyltransferase
VTGVSGSPGQTKGESRPGGEGDRRPCLSGADWDHLAGWWLDTFSNGADIEYEAQIIPLAAEHLASCRRVLDVGTGEGQLARRLGSGQPEGLVIGLDPSIEQVRNAVAQGSSPLYLRARGEEIPFRSGSFDGVLCCLAIEHADDPETVMTEMARVLAPGGRLVLIVNHPVTQGPASGLVDDHLLGERYWRIGPYLHERVVVEEVDPGVPIRFAHRPLSAYVNSLCDEGLVLTRLEEPAPPVEFLADSVDLTLELSMPRLCLMCFEWPTRPAGERQ